MANQSHSKDQSQNKPRHDEGGRSGGQHHGAGGTKNVSQEAVGAGKGKDPNNFANDPQRAREAGRKGGESRKG